MERGDVVYALFEFSDYAGRKWRPTAVVSPAAYNAGPDVIVVAVTSRTARPWFGDVTVQDWREAGLRIPSMVRAGRLQVVDQRFLGRRLGRLSATDMARVEAALRRVLDL